MAPALLYDRLDNNAVCCNLCSHRCVIKDGNRGVCLVRENRSGTLETLAQNLIARHIDPIEKKPLFHVMPGSRSYSIAATGCNFKCRFCQNADIAQEIPKKRGGYLIGEACTPEFIVDDALRNKCRSISYTYTEPTVYFEIAFETAKIAAQKGLRNVFVTNGYMTSEALQMMSPYLDAANVDLKAFNNDFYKKLCGAKLKHVQETLILMRSLGVFIEVTTLMIPGLNDDEREIEDLAAFISESLGPETPWHISRFHPTYKLTDRPPTPVDTLVRARDIGIKKGLKYVYTGNVPGEAGENTFCYNCGNIVIERCGFTIQNYNIDQGKCSFCKTDMDGIDL